MVQSEAQKRAKAKYYAKLRENEEYKKSMAQMIHRLILNIQ